MALFALLLLLPLFTEIAALKEESNKSDDAAIRPYCARNITISNSQELSHSADTPDCLEGRINCRSLWYAFTQCTIVTQSTFRILEGMYILNGSLGTVYNTSFGEELREVRVIGDGINKTVIDGMGEYGFAFVNVSNLTISDLSLFNCSQTRPSTSYTQELGHRHSQPFQVGIYIWRCINVNVFRISIRDSNAVGLVVYETWGAVTILDSLFQNNVNHPGYILNETDGNGLPGGGGVNIEFPFCPPGHFHDSECGRNTVYKANYTISNCLFESNSAHTIMEVQNQFILPNGSIHQAFGRGGGLAVYFSGGTNHVNMSILDCHFFNNKAIYGAGLFAEFHDHSHNNSLTVSSSTFFNNSCYNSDHMNGAGGGGMRLAFVFYDIEKQSVANNTILVSNCTVTQNKAYFGGGLSFLSGLEQNLLHSTNRVLLVNNTWAKNTARLGAAAYFTAFNQVKIGVRPAIHVLSNTFQDNTILYADSSMSNYFAGSGTVYCYNMPLSLKGNNNFSNNTGTGLVTVGAHVHVLPHSVTVFTGNVASNGGAMAFYANGWLTIHPNTVVHFVNNTALIRGGALYADMTGGNEILTSRDCFLHYTNWQVGAENWRASLLFINNHAHSGEGGDIFVSSVYPCIWGGSYGDANTSVDVRRKVFSWSPFNYGGKNASIGSGVSTIKWKFKENHHDHYSVSIVPGQLHDFRDQFAMYNDLDKLTNTAMLASNLDTNIVVAPDSKFTINMVRFLSQSSTTTSNASSRIQLQSVSDPPMIISFDVTALPCPPGAWLSPSKENSSLFACRCASISEPGYLTGATCSGGNLVFDIHVIKGYWVGYVDISGYWVSSPCPVSFCNNTNEKFGRMKFNANNIPEEICAKHRTGEICGECKTNYSLVATSTGFQCEMCSSSISFAVALLEWFLIQFGTTTATVGLILLFGIDIASGKFASFVFFCQVVPVLNLQLCQCISGDSLKALWQFYMAVYSVWSLELSDHLNIDVCLPGVSNPILLAFLKYIFALYPFVLIGLVACLTRCCKNYGCIRINPQQRKSGLQNCIYRLLQFLSQRITDRGITTCIVITYCKLTYLSFFILTPAYITLPHNVTSKPDAASENIRVWYYGQWKYFGVPHIAYATPVLILYSIFGIFPLLIFIVYPGVTSCLRKHNAMMALGGKVEDLVRKKFGEYLYHVLGIFQKHYNDKLEWFAVMWFAYRFALYCNYTFNSNIWSILTVQIIMGMVFLLVHAVFQPYKNRLYNIVDCFFFANIILLSAVTSQASQNQSLSSKMYAAIILVLLTLPYAYFALCILLSIISKVTSKNSSTCICVNSCSRNEGANDENRPLVDAGRIDGDQPVRVNQQQDGQQFERPELLYYESTG